MWEKNKIKNIFDDFCDNKFIKQFHEQIKKEKHVKYFFKKFIKKYESLINKIKKRTDNQSMD